MEWNGFVRKDLDGMVWFRIVWMESYLNKGQRKTNKDNNALNHTPIIPFPV